MSQGMAVKREHRLGLSVGVRLNQIRRAAASLPVEYMIAIAVHRIGAGTGPLHLSAAAGDTQGVEKSVLTVLHPEVPGGHRGRSSPKRTVTQPAIRLIGVEVRRIRPRTGRCAQCSQATCGDTVFQSVDHHYMTPPTTHNSLNNKAQH